MFKAICPYVRPVKIPDHATPYCTAESAFRKPTRHLPISGLLIAIIWAAITLGVLKLDPARHFEQSMIALKQAEDAQHRKHLDTTLSKEDEQAAIQECAKVASALNDQHYEQADQRITDLVNRYPGFYAALPLQAEVYFKQLKHEAALQALENAERAGEKGPRMELLRVKKWVIRGEPDRAIQWLDETQDAAEQDPTVLLERATLYLHLNAYSSARSNLVQLLSVDPQHLQGHIRLSSLLFKLQEEDEARAHFSAAQAIDSTHPDLRLLDLEINLLDGEEQQVREKLLSLGTDFPDHASIQIKIAKLELFMKQAGAALERVEKISSGENRHERFAAHMLHAQIMIEHELLTDAERDLELALAIQPSHLPAQQAKARILMARKNWNAALKILTPLRKKHPQQTMLYLMEAACQEHIGDTEQTRTLLLHIRETRPDNPAIAIRLSNFYQAQGNLQEAIHLLETFVEAHPDNHIAINNLIYLLADQGQDLDHPQRLAQQLMEAHPNNPLFADTIGWVHIQRKAFNEAIP
ncbi:MAG: tetratricopeptide repeat protein, partial [Verrucomicrobiota bacterium]